MASQRRGGEANKDDDVMGGKKKPVLGGGSLKQIYLTQRFLGEIRRSSGLHFRGTLNTLSARKRTLTRDIASTSGRNSRRRPTENNLSLSSDLGSRFGDKRGRPGVACSQAVLGSTGEGEVSLSRTLSRGLGRVWKSPKSPGRPCHLLSGLGRPPPPRKPM